VKADASTPSDSWCRAKAKERYHDEGYIDAEPHGNGAGAGSLEQFASLEAVQGKLLNVAPREFEVLIKDVLLLSGFERVGVTRYLQDGGIDVVAYPGERIWPLQDGMVQLQAKRWLHAVGRKEVAELRGSLDTYARGVAVTTGHFSRAAIAEARSSGENSIGLVDGLRLSSIIVSIKPS
jgi:restriction endonuclease Mrr